MPDGAVSEIVELNETIVLPTVSAVQCAAVTSTVGRHERGGAAVAEVIGLVVEEDDRDIGVTLAVGLPPVMAVAEMAGTVTRPATAVAASRRVRSEPRRRARGRRSMKCLSVIDRAPRAAVVT